MGDVMRRDKQEMQRISEVIMGNADNWPSEMVALKETRSFTGGAYSPRTVANEISRGSGPEGVFKVGRATMIPKVSFTEWLLARAGRR